MNWVQFNNQAVLILSCLFHPQMFYSNIYFLHLPALSVQWYNKLTETS